MLQSGYDTRHYRAFLLRLWQERAASPDRPAVWRFALEEARTGERHGFGSLEAMVSFLRAQMEQDCERCKPKEEID